MLKTNNKVTYRPDIDGLRAIAVIAVILFHFFPSKFRGGFVGVDVFFVISGYLVTNILFNNIISERFSFNTFYIKRIQRLFPSLIIVLTFCIITGLLFLASDELENLGKHIIGGSTFFENFLLFKESGYFDKNSDLKPLLHLWSLAIEEQFYLIWPLVIFFSYKKGKKNLIRTLFFIFSFSILLNFFLTKNYQSFSFYLIATRLWELACGGLLIFSEYYLDFLKKLISTSSIFSKINLDISFIGLILIFLSFYLLDKDKHFPGFWVVLPVLGTLLLIIAGPKAKVNTLLSTKVLVYIGLISYPLYLWHWPLISFANIISLSSISNKTRYILIATSFILAVVSFEFIEKPLKKLHSSNIIPASLVSLLIILATVGFLLLKFKGFPARYPSIELARKSKEVYQSTQETAMGKACMQKFLKIEMCSISKISEKPTIALIGDSHANHLFPGLRKFYDQKGENLLLLAKSGTPPFYKTVSIRNHQVSLDVSLDDVFELISKTKSIHTVILSSFWGSYVEEEGVPVADYKYKNIIEDSLNSSEKDQKKVFRESLNRTIKFLKQQGKKIVIFYDIPSLPFYLEKCLPRPLINNVAECSFSVEDEQRKQIEYRSIVNEVIKIDDAIVAYDPLPIICDRQHKKNECSISKKDKIIYSNEHHLSIYGSKYLINKLFSGF